MSYATNLEHNKLYVNVLLDILPPRVSPFSIYANGQQIRHAYDN